MAADDAEVFRLTINRGPAGELIPHARLLIDPANPWEMGAVMGVATAALQIAATKVANEQVATSPQSLVVYTHAMLHHKSRALANEGNPQTAANLHLSEPPNEQAPT